MNEKLLLLSSSSPFCENYDLHDSICHSLIDLEEEKSKDEIMELLIRAQQFLDENIEDDIARDIFSLILKCYSHFPCEFIPILEQLYLKSRNNLNYTIITASVISYYNQNNYSSYLFDYKSFVIEIINTFNNITNHEINPPFELEFLLDILLISDLSDNFIQLNILPIFNYIFINNSRNQNFYDSNKDKIIFLIKKVIRVSFFNIICNFLPINQDTYSEMKTDDLTFLIPLIPNVLFKKLFNLNEEIILKSKEIRLPFVNIFLQKCKELNLKIRPIEKLLESISFEEIVPQIISIAQKYKIITPENITIHDNSIDSSSILSELHFYIDILSKLCENKQSAAKVIVTSFVKFFQKKIKKEDFNKTFDEMFLSAIASDQNVIDILIDFLQFLDEEYLKLYYQKAHMHNLINMILQMDNILPYSFIKVIDRYSIYTFISKRILLNIQITPRLYYIYKFSNENVNEFKPKRLLEKNFTYRLKLNISTTTNLDDPQLISFIKENDYLLLTSMNDESLSFIIKALIFAENDKCSIIGLTNSNAIPFYAIVLRNLKIFNRKYYSISNDLYIDIFFEALKTKFNSSSPNIKASIYSIFQSHKITKSINQFNIKMFDILTVWLISGKCDYYETDILNYLISDINKLKYIKTNLNELIKHILKKSRSENALFMDKFMQRYNFYKESFHMFKIPLSYFDDKKIMNFDILIKYFLTSHNVENDDTVINYIFSKSTKNYYTNSSIEELNERKRFIIDHLFALIDDKKSRYQWFYCLERMTYQSLFLFEEKSDQIFESVLHELENYLILFDENNDSENVEIENEAKTAICAFSFFISSLRSIHIMDEFVNWYFSKLEQFNEIQIFCFNYIFNSIFDINGLKHILFSIFKKYNYEDVISKLIEKNASNDVFHYNYILILKSLRNKFESFSKNLDIYSIPIEELQKTKTPFAHELKYLKNDIFLPIKTITRNSFQNLPQTQLNMKLFAFMENIERNKGEKSSSNFIEYTYHSADFGFNLKKPYSIMSDYYRYIYNESPWTYYMVVGNKLHIYDHACILNKELEDMIKYSLNEIDVLLTNKYIFSNLATNIFSLTENDFSEACKFIDSVDDQYITVFLMLLEKQFNTFIEKEKKKENTCNYLNRLLLVFVLISKLEKFKQSYQDFEESLLKQILQPKYRNDEKVLSKIADMYINMKLRQTSVKFLHVIVLMYKTNNFDLIYKATKLSNDYFTELLQYNFEKIKNLYLFEIKKKELSLSKIMELIDYVPSLKGLDDNTNFLNRLFNEFGLRNYHNTISSIMAFKELISSENEESEGLYNEYLKLLISQKLEKECCIKIINSFTPDRNIYDYDAFYNYDEKEECSIPSKILNSDPVFWNFFLENRMEIFQIILDNLFMLKYTSVSFKIMDEYPDFFPFLSRHEFFIKRLCYCLNNKQTYELLIDRENILESTLSQMPLNNIQIWKSNIKINYNGQRGIDNGGLRRDWFTKLSKELFNPNLGLFSITEKMKYHPNAQSYANPNHLQLFKFCGFLTAKAIILEENVDVNFTNAFLCRILGKDVELNDIEEIDEEVFKSLHFILNNDLNLYEMYEEYFAVDHDNFGKIETYELIENGDQVRVTNENKLNYVKLMIDYYSKNSIDCQIQAFCEGFTSLIQQKYIKLFTPRELGLLISGVSLISVDILKENTIYEFPYTSNSPPVVWFFNSISKWDQSDLKKLLMFITGSPNLPFTGLNIPIKIQCGGEKDRLPEAHTCFNTLCLPRYENEEQLNYNFMQAFANESFLLI